jgi:hypothetical protein
MNIVCSDATGDVVCVQNTAAGPLELPFEDGFAAITNHIVRDEDILWLHERGVTKLPENPDVRARRGTCLNYCRRHNRRCSGPELRDFISAYRGGSAAFAHNKGTIYLTYCCPQNEPGVIWIQEGFGAVGRASSFERVEV